MSTLPSTFWAKVEKTDDCWTWTGCLSPDGYGRFGGHAQFGTSLPHRAAWQQENGPVPEGLELDHLCNNRACVRPVHMEPVTHEENVRRAFARRTHCPNGHPYSDETRVPDYVGRFRCLLCRRVANAKSIRDARRRRYPADRPFPWDVKQWAIGRGIPVRMQGSVSRSVLDAYVAAHPEFQQKAVA